MTTQIIRIEHPYDGKGLFRSEDETGTTRIEDSCLNELRERHNEYFPNAYRELSKIGLTLLPAQHCAFKSIASIQEWIFPDDFEIIFELGFDVLLIEVSHCIELEYQVVYIKEDIQSVRNINELFK